MKYRVGEIKVMRVSYQGCHKVMTDDTETST